MAALVLAAGWILHPQDVSACSCGSPTLGSRYEHSTHVFLAVITAQYIEPSGEHSPIRSMFRVTERFKGSPPFPAFEHRDDENECGIHLEPGVEYLFFARDDGHIGHCSGIRRTEEAGNEIAALRAFRSGEHSALQEPWYFRASEDGCFLATLFGIGQTHAAGVFRVSATRGPVDSQRVPDFDAVELNISLRNDGEGRGPEQVHLMLDSVAYTPAWKVRELETSEGRSVKLPGAYVLGERETEDVVRRLAGSEAVRIRVGGQGFRPDLHIQVSTANLADGAEKMLACLESFR